MIDPTRRVKFIEAQVKIISTQIDICDPDDLPRLFVRLDELRIELEVLIHLENIRNYGFTNVKQGGEEAEVFTWCVKYQKCPTPGFQKYCNNLREMADSLGYT